MIALRNDDDFGICRFLLGLKSLQGRNLVLFGAPRSPLFRENYSIILKLSSIFYVFLEVICRSLSEKVLKYLIRSSISFGRTDEKSNDLPLIG